MTQEKKRFWKDWSNKDRWLFLLMILFTIGLLIAMVFTIKTRWNQFVNILIPDVSGIHFEDFLPLFNILIPPIVFFIFYIKLLRFRVWINKTVGEGLITQRNSVRHVIAVFFSFPFIFYLLISSAGKTIPSVAQFSLIGIAPTLGGLILAAANRKTLKRTQYNQLVAIAQKFIVATILLILFAVMMVNSDTFGVPQLTIIEWSTEGFVRWLLFWVASWSFFIGSYLFLLGLIDLVYSLQFLRKK